MINSKILKINQEDDLFYIHNLEIYNIHKLEQMLYDMMHIVK
jgi:hypothetical protein